MKTKLTVLSLVISTLVGCGGGGGSSTPSVPDVPETPVIPTTPCEDGSCLEDDGFLTPNIPGTELESSTPIPVEERITKILEVSKESVDVICAEYKCAVNEDIVSFEGSNLTVLPQSATLVANIPYENSVSDVLSLISAKWSNSDGEYDVVSRMLEFGVDFIKVEYIIDRSVISEFVKGEFVSNVLVEQNGSEIPVSMSHMSATAADIEVSKVISKFSEDSLTSKPGEYDPVDPDFDQTHSNGYDIATILGVDGDERLTTRIVSFCEDSANSCKNENGIAVMSYKGADFYPSESIVKYNIAHNVESEAIVGYEYEWSSSAIKTNSYMTTEMHMNDFALEGNQFTATLYQELELGETTAMTLFRDRGHHPLIRSRVGANFITESDAIIQENYNHDIEINDLIGSTHYRCYA